MIYSYSRRPVKIIKKSLIYFHDFFSTLFYRLFSGSHAGIEKYDLKPCQVYPKGKNLKPDFLILNDFDSFQPFIKKSDFLCSIGSCFAEEIKPYLVEKGYHYLQLEKSRWFSCDWGRVYTSANLKQVMQYSFGIKNFKNRVWTTQRGYEDSLRDYAIENPYFKLKEDLEKNISTHTIFSRQTFLEAQIIIVTLGVNEGWIDSEGIVSGRMPPLEDIKSGKYKLANLSVSENYENIEGALKILWQCHQNVKVIFTLSPVPAFATFEQENVASTSFENKAKILLAIKQITSKYEEQSYYFPSFEMVYCAMRSPWKYDNRHIKKINVHQIMRNFENLYCVN